MRQCGVAATIDAGDNHPAVLIVVRHRITRFFQCAHRHRFETLQHASRVIGDWIGFYNTR